MQYLTRIEKAAILSDTPIPEKSLLGIPTDPADWMKYGDLCAQAAVAKSFTEYDWHPDGTLPGPGEIFVFGSNLAGVHGAGAARAALDRFMATWGIGHGRTGLCYALPTKDERIETLSLERIEFYVAKFLNHARLNPGTRFFVTRVGCGLAGIKDEVMAKFFYGAPQNCILPDTWRPIFEDGDRLTEDCITGLMDDPLRLELNLDVLRGGIKLGELNVATAKSTAGKSIITPKD